MWTRQLPTDNDKRNSSYVDRFDAGMRVYDE